MEFDNLFSDDYFQARDKFIKAASDAGFALNSIKHPQNGPENREIFMDFALLGNENAKNMLVIISGTHGPEGYCGSAVQYGLIKNGISSEWAEKYKILMVHAHNPYGFAWDIRFNEDNIDLNRNYLSDFSNLPENPLYEEVKDWAMPKDLSDATIAECFNNLMQYANKNGFAKLQTALTSGQYKYSDGVYYGGNAPSWSNITLSENIKKYAQDIESIVIIDMHTGLGNFGHGELITGFDADSTEYSKLTAIWGDMVKSSANGQSVSAKLSGCLDEAMVRMLKGINTAFIAIEFGTIDPISVFRATQATAWLQSYGDKNSELSGVIRAQSRDAFYPQSSEWNQKVWNRSLEVISKAIASFD